MGAVPGCRQKDFNDPGRSFLSHRQVAGPHSTIQVCWYWACDCVFAIYTSADHDEGKMLILDGARSCQNLCACLFEPQPRLNIPQLTARGYAHAHTHVRRYRCAQTGRTNSTFPLSKYARRPAPRRLVSAARRSQTFRRPRCVSLPPSPPEQQTAVAFRVLPLWLCGEGYSACKHTECHQNRNM